MLLRMLDESNVLSFLFLVSIKGMWKKGESKIFFCNPNGGKLKAAP